MNPKHPEAGHIPPTEIVKQPEQETWNDPALTPEQNRQINDLLKEALDKDAVEQLEKKPVELTENEIITSELGEIFDTWLAPEKLEALNALTTEAEAIINPLRMDAKLVLNIIWKKMKTLGDTLPSAELDALRAKNKILSRAVGMINGGLVDHTR